MTIKPLLKKFGKYYIVSFSDFMLEYGILWNQVYRVMCFIEIDTNDVYEMTITSFNTEIEYIQQGVVTNSYLL